MYLTLGLFFPQIFELQIQPRRHEEQLYEQQLLNVVADSCRFILHEVIHVMGYFVHPEYEGLRQWDTQHSRAGSNSINQEAGIGQKHVFYEYFDDVL
jgi:hypothetical protein